MIQLLGYWLHIGHFPQLTCDQDRRQDSVIHLPVETETQLRLPSVQAELKQWYWWGNFIGHKALYSM